MAIFRINPRTSGNYNCHDSYLPCLNRDMQRDSHVNLQCKGVDCCPLFDLGGAAIWSGSRNGPWTLTVLRCCHHAFLFLLLGAGGAAQLSQDVARDQVELLLSTISIPAPWSRRDTTIAAFQALIAFFNSITPLESTVSMSAPQSRWNSTIAMFQAQTLDITGVTRL